MKKRPSSDDKTFFCPMCQKDVPKVGISFYVGNPTEFLICDLCFNNSVIPLVGYPLRVLNRRKVWK